MNNNKSKFVRIVSIALCAMIIVSVLFSAPSFVSAKTKSSPRNKKHVTTHIPTPTPMPILTPTPIPTPTSIPVPTPEPTPVPTPEPTIYSLSLENYQKVVYVKDFGAYADGVHDDTQAINQALNSGADAVIFEPNALYKTNDIITMETSGVTVFGNKATLFTDNDYRSRANYSEWYFTVTANDITINELNIEARETILVGYKTQFAIMFASNVTVDACIFTIPSTVLSGGGSHDIEYSNLDLFTGWHNITIQNSTFTNLADTNAGVAAEFRDIYNKEAGDLIFTNNTLTSNCHDEILATFTGSSTTITNINVTNNEINALPGTVSKPRTLGLSLGYDGFGLDNVTFSGNTVNVYADFAAIAVGDSKNVTIENNTINFTPITHANPSFLVKGSYIDNNVNVTNNNIVIKNNSSTNFGGISHGYLNLTYNTITCNTTVTEALFTNNSVVNNNTIIVNAATKRLGSSLKTFEGNTVTFNSSISTMFEFYNTTFTSDVNINNNIINYEKATTTNDTLFMLNGTTLNGYAFSLSSNEVTCSPTSTTKSFYYMAISDSTPQNIVLTDNALSKYTNSYIQGGMSSIYNIITN